MKERKRGEKKGKRDYREWENDEKGERREDLNPTDPLLTDSRADTGRVSLFTAFFVKGREKKNEARIYDKREK